jgi:hypothetical protein
MLEFPLEDVRHTLHSYDNDSWAGTPCRLFSFDHYFSRTTLDDHCLTKEGARLCEWRQFFYLQISDVLRVTRQDGGLAGESFFGTRYISY